MFEQKTKELQFQQCIEAAQERGFERLGLTGSESWHTDPKHLLFNLARYKFAAKMLAGREHVLELGCGDCFGTRIVQAEVKKLTATDFDPVFVQDAQARMTPGWQFDVFAHDLLAEGPVPGSYDGLYALDVLEHIKPEQEMTFLTNAIASLTTHGVGLIGIPSLESQVYASPISKAGHVNCKTAPDLKTLMMSFFHNVFMFSMNDEVVHTGYHKMAHYIWALGVGKKLPE